MAQTKKSSADNGPVRSLHDVIPRTECLLEAFADGQRDAGMTGVTFLMPGPALAQQLATRDAAAAALGARVGHEWVDTRLVGKSLLSCLYVEKFAAGLLVWRWVWYENGEQWTVLEFDISADVRGIVHILPNVAQ
jgi:hypothetical protein